MSEAQVLAPMIPLNASLRLASTICLLLFAVSARAGGVRVIQNGALLETPFATFPQLYTASECGVLGIAFDPNYVVDRYVYVFVTVSASEQRIVRFTDVNPPF